MQQSDSIGTSADFLSLRPSPRNPLLSTSPLATSDGLADALSNCAATLYVLADLFGFDDEKAGYSVLDNQNTRYGMWMQLHGVADLLKAASKIATVADSDEVFEEITVPFSKAEYGRLKTAAEFKGLSVEAFVESAVRKGLGRAQDEAWRTEWRSQSSHQDETP